MRPFRPALGVVLLCFGSLPVASVAAFAAEPVEVLDVRHWSYDGYTRVVVEFTGPVETVVKQLGATGDLPDRLYLDLPRVSVADAWSEPIPVTDGLLQRVRLAQNSPGRARLVIDLERYGRHRLFTLRGPDRVVLDVYAKPVSARGAVAAAGQTVAPAISPSLRSVHTVVIDPGHGGDDPGASGRRGLLEKDLTLAVAVDLRDRLRDRGFQVVMTRERDRAGTREERTAMAEGAGADIFVSLHANAAEGSKAHGLETYYLDQSHERHTLRVAARESGVRPHELDPLQLAMAGLRVGEVSAHSAQLADLVHAQVVEGVRKVYGSVRDLGVKRGPFHVLFLSSAPSILIEMGFVTNRQEAKRLGTKLYRAVVAEQIARGLAGYRTRRMQVASRSER